MRKIFAVGAALALSAAPGSPAQAATGYVGTSCALVALLEDAANLGNPTSLTAIMTAAVTAVDPADRVQVKCELINYAQTLAVSTSGAPAVVAVVDPTPRVSLSAVVFQHDAPEVCTTITFNGVSKVSCALVLRNEIPPGPVCALLGICEGGSLGAEPWAVIPHEVTG